MWVKGERVRGGRGGRVFTGDSGGRRNACGSRKEKSDSGLHGELVVKGCYRSPVE